MVSRHLTPPPKRTTITLGPAYAGLPRASGAPSIMAPRLPAAPTKRLRVSPEVRRWFMLRSWCGALSETLLQNEVGPRVHAFLVHGVPDAFADVGLDVNAHRG